MGEKRKGNPNWYEVRLPNGRITYRKKVQDSSGAHRLQGRDEESLSDAASVWDVATHSVTPHNIPLTPATEDVLGALRDADIDPLIVGGSVRDSLISSGPPKDIDIECHHTDGADHLRDALTGFRVDEVGQSFGVLKVRHKGEDFDISLPRRDSAPAGNKKHRGIIATTDPAMSLTEASKRRDFTFNALSYDPERDVLIDIHGGVEDLDTGTLRVVDEETFTDDPLRVLRGVQFAGRYGMTWDEDSSALARRMSWEGLARERVDIEMRKLLVKGNSYARGLSALRDAGWEGAVPDINAAYALDYGGWRIIDRIPAITKDPALRAAHMGKWLAHDRDAGRYMSQMGLSRREYKRVLPVLESIRNPGDKLLLRRGLRAWVTNEEELKTAHKLRRAMRDYDDTSRRIGEHPWTVPEPYRVDGEMLKNLGVTPGPNMGMALKNSRIVQDRNGEITDAQIRIIADRYR